MESISATASAVWRKKTPAEDRTDSAVDASSRSGVGCAYGSHLFSVFARAFRSKGLAICSFIPMVFAACRSDQSSPEFPSRSPHSAYCPLPAEPDGLSNPSLTDPPGGRPGVSDPPHKVTIKPLESPAYVGEILQGLPVKEKWDSKSCRRFCGFFHLKNKHISLQKPPIVKGSDLVK